MDGKVFLQPETVREMLTLQKFPGMSENESVGLAWHFDGNDYNHSGGDPGISTLAYFNPNTDRGMIFFSNGGDLDLSKFGSWVLLLRSDDSCSKREYERSVNCGGD